MEGRLESREEAGRRLATLLAEYADRRDVIVLALPRGGVPVGREIARAIRAPLDLFFVRKVGVSQYPELAMGAVASGGVKSINSELVREFGLSRAEVAAAVERSLGELERQESVFRPGRPALELKGKTVILTDDGIATGYTMLVAIEAVKRLGAASVVVATGAAPPSTMQEIRSKADEAVCLLTPRDFRAVGLYYEDFSQVTDEEVKRLLATADATRES